MKLYIWFEDGKWWISYLKRGTFSWCGATPKEARDNRQADLRVKDEDCSTVQCQSAKNSLSNNGGTLWIKENLH